MKDQRYPPEDLQMLFNLPPSLHTLNLKLLEFHHLLPAMVDEFKSIKKINIIW